MLHNVTKCYSGLSFVNQATYYKIQYSLVVPKIHEHYAVNIG